MTGYMASGVRGTRNGMERTTYMKRSWRDRPRDYCLVHELLGEAAGPCHGLIHLHHVDPTDEDSRTVQVCNGHHQHVHSVLRSLSVTTERPWRTCHHRHPTREGREACERRLNRAA